LLGLGVENGFVGRFCEFGAEGFETVEILDGAAVEAFGLGLVAEELQPGIGIAGDAMEAFGERAVALLGAGDFELAIAEELRVDEVDGLGGVHGVVERGGEEAAFEASGAQQGLLGEGDALDGEKLLGVDGVVDFDEVGAEIDDVVGLFEEDDGEGGCQESVFAGVLGRSGFAFGGTRTRRAGGVGLVGGELFVGDLVGQCKGLSF